MQKVFIVTGGKAEGKTTYTANLIHLLRKDHRLKICGFLARGYWNNACRSHYMLENINPEKHLLICSAQAFEGAIQAGPYFFNPGTVEYAKDQVMQSISSCQLAVIDEVGKLELKGLIWHKLLIDLLNLTEVPLLLVIRDIFAEKIIEKYHILNTEVFNIHEQDPQHAAARIIQTIG